MISSVEIDANNGSTVTDTATVSDLSYSSTGVSYNYLAGALPLYAKSAEYKYAENYGVDITNTMNKEIIKVTGLEAGKYTIKMDGKTVAEVTAEHISSIQTKYNELLGSDELEQILNKGIEKSRALAKEKYDLMKERMGVTRKEL